MFWTDDPSPDITIVQRCFARHSSHNILMARVRQFDVHVGACEEFKAREHLQVIFSTVDMSAIMQDGKALHSQLNKNFECCGMMHPTTTRILRD